MAVTGGGGGKPTKRKAVVAAKLPARPVAPARSNAGGATRGTNRATQVQALNAARKATAKPAPVRTTAQAQQLVRQSPARITLPKIGPISLPRSPQSFPRGVPQIDLFRDISNRIADVTGQRRSRRGRR